MRFRHMAWILPLLLCCCNKQGPDPVNPVSTELAYTVSYDSVYTCYPYSNVTLAYTIKLTSGDIFKTPVTVSVTGLPPGILATPPSQTVAGLLGGAFTIAVGNVPPGNDTANFVYSSVNGTQTHKLILNILPPVDYAAKMAGSYPGSYDFCQPDSLINYTSNVYTVTDTPYLMKITNLKNMGSGFVVRAWASSMMGAALVSIYPQTIGGYTIWGSGTFAQDGSANPNNYRMIIKDTIAHGVDTQYCTIHLQH